MKNEIFNDVLERVCSEMELECSSVLHSNKEECVDARYVVIAILSERYSDRQISEVSGWSLSLVNKARNTFRERCKFRWGLKSIYLNMLKNVTDNE